MDNLAVKMCGITKIFNNKKANDSVDFNLKQGSIHGLLGENGAGKTTLMNVLYGLYRQEEGDIYINGTKEDISSPVKAMSWVLAWCISTLCWQDHCRSLKILCLAENRAKVFCWIQKR